MRCAWLIVLAACGGGAKKPAGGPGNETRDVEIAPCPDEAAVVAMAAEIWTPSTNVPTPFTSQRLCRPYWESTSSHQAGVNAPRTPP